VYISLRGSPACVKKRVLLHFLLGCFFPLFIVASSGVIVIHVSRISLSLPEEMWEVIIGKDSPETKHKFMHNHCDQFVIFTEVTSLGHLRFQFITGMDSLSYGKTFRYHVHWIFFSLLDFFKINFLTLMTIPSIFHKVFLIDLCVKYFCGSELLD
jgi:hypothetical protein